MMKKLVLAVGWLSCWMALIGIESAVAQMGAGAQEYIQSSSPLGNGVVVTATTVPGQPTRTVVGYGSTLSRPNLSRRALSQSNAERGMAQSTASSGPVAWSNGQRSNGQNNGQNNGQSVLNPALSGRQGVNNSDSDTSLAGYPAAAVRREATQSSWSNGQSGGPTRQRGVSGVTGWNARQVSPSGEAADQVPTLGTPTPYPAPSDEVPSMAPAGQSAMTGPAICAPGIPGATGAASGARVYRPLIQLRNLPPGTYVGQGILGQPAAYVDGQPIRNLLRYFTY